MHRSGTSMVTRLLVECGMFVGEGDDLLPPSEEDNREGYWEHRRIVEINEAILQMFGGSWQHPPELPEGWTALEGIDELRVQAREVLRSLSTRPFWGWKDPRTCLTLPFWRELVPNMVVVLCVRHPIEVAQSLVARRHAYASRAEALDLWHDYYARAYKAIGDGPRVVTHYISYFYDAEREFRRVLDFAEIAVSEAEISSATRTINRDLWRGFRIDEAQLEEEAPASVLRLYNQLRAEGGEVLATLCADEAFQEELTRIALEKSLQRIDRLEQLSLERADEIVRLRGMLEDVLHVRRLLSRGLSRRERADEVRWIWGRVKGRVGRVFHRGQAPKKSTRAKYAACDR